LKIPALQGRNQHSRRTSFLHFTLNQDTLAIGEPVWISLKDAAWPLCLLIAYHWIRASVTVWKEINKESRIVEVESGLYLPDQQKERHFVQTDSPAFFRAKIIILVIVFIGLLGAALRGLTVVANNKVRSTNVRDTVHTPEASVEFIHTALVFHMSKRSFFVLGEPVAMSMFLANTSDGTAHDISTHGALRVMPLGADQAEREENQWRQLKASWLVTEERPSGRDLGKGGKELFDVVTDSKLSKKDMRQLGSNPPKEVVYFFGNLSWGENTGRYDTEMCRYFLPNIVGTPDEPIVRHNCLTGHNMIRRPLIQPR
jgi:hypothetical protein